MSKYAILTVNCRDCVLQKPCMEYLAEERTLDDHEGVACMLQAALNHHLAHLVKAENQLCDEWDRIALNQTELLDDILFLKQYASALQDDEADFRDEVADFEKERAAADEDRWMSTDDYHCPLHAEQCQTLSEFRRGLLSIAEKQSSCGICVKDEGFHLE